LFSHECKQIFPLITHSLHPTGDQLEHFCNVVWVRLSARGPEFVNKSNLRGCSTDLGGVF